MSGETGAPVIGTERIATLDIVRGFALFGVLWMNLQEHAGLAMPEDKLIHLFGARADAVVGFISAWLAAGKAQALFSYLFGLGFALFLDRATARGVDGTILYVRRLTFLLVFGAAHFLLLWAGDILHAYAAMGFLLILTRRWPNWLMLAAGLTFAMGGMIAMRILYDLTIPGQAPPWANVQEAMAVEAYPIFMGHDYPAYVGMLARLAGPGFYVWPIAWIFLAWIFGRFLIGAWVYRQGWMQHSERFAAGFRRWMPWLLAVGLTLAIVGPVLRTVGYKPVGSVRWLLTVMGQLTYVVLPAGYAALIVVLCQSPAWRQRLSGLGMAGRMALTNYVTQSFVFFFMLYGFGLGLMPYMGPVACLLLGVPVFAAQIAFSRWWLARHHFGPLEWVWRWATYGERQPLRRCAEEMALPA